MGINRKPVQRIVGTSKESREPAHPGDGSPGGKSTARPAPGARPDARPDINHSGTTAPAGAGAGAHPPEPQEEDTITVQTPEIKTAPPAKRGRPAKPKARANKPAVSAGDSCAAVIRTVELFAVVRFGEGAKFTESELQLIEPSLTTLIDQYGDAVEKYGGLLSVVPLVVGVISYVNRLAKLATPATESAPPPAPATESTQAPAPSVRSLWGDDQSVSSPAPGAATGSPTPVDNGSAPMSFERLT